MIQLVEIARDLISSDSEDLPEQFAAAGIYISEAGEAKHTGIIIKHHEDYYLFHFDGKLKLEQPTGKCFFHKNFLFVKEATVSMFLAHCKIILKNANPKYGYFYPGSFYDVEGNYFSEIQMPEYMTCVGFCLNVINGFIEEELYLTIGDWGRETLSQKYINNTIEMFKEKIPDISIDKLIEHIRRIAPNEYLAAAYLQDIPIRKTAVDAIIFNVNEAIYLKSQISHS